jgi:hypothetical protein
VEYFKRIQDTNFTVSVQKLQDLFLKSSFAPDKVKFVKINKKLATTIFEEYEKALGFECHFQDMAMKLASSDKEPHTLLVLQCPKDHHYGMAFDTVTGSFLLSFHQPLQQAAEELNLLSTTVLCMEICSYCPRLIKKSK